MWAKRIATHANDEVHHFNFSFGLYHFLVKQCESSSQLFCCCVWSFCKKSRCRHAMICCYKSFVVLKFLFFDLLYVRILDIVQESEYFLCKVWKYLSIRKLLQHHKILYDNFFLQNEFFFGMQTNAVSFLGKMLYRIFVE